MKNKIKIIQQAPITGRKVGWAPYSKKVTNSGDNETDASAAEVSVVFSFASLVENVKLILSFNGLSSGGFTLTTVVATRSKPEHDIH